MGIARRMPPQCHVATSALHPNETFPMSQFEVRRQSIPGWKWRGGPPLISVGSPPRSRTTYWDTACRRRCQGNRSEERLRGGGGVGAVVGAEADGSTSSARAGGQSSKGDGSFTPQSCARTPTRAGTITDDTMRTFHGQGGGGGVISGGSP